MASRVYLDANASEPLRPQARAAVLAALEADANPASVHAPGRAARTILDAARDALAACFGAHPGRVVVTSGGAEANALAIHVLGQGRRLIVAAVEHDSVLAAAPGAATLPVQADGTARLDALAPLLADGPALLCLMAANNETGAIQPVREAAAICRAHGALLHVDAIQAAGRVPLDLAGLGADSLAISGHKLGGPLGAGALLFAADPPVRPLIPGGGQERGMRGGTPPLPAIAGMAAAATAALAASVNDLAALRDAAERAALASGGVVVAGDAPRLANTLCVALPGVAAATQVMALDLEGVAVSAGAACSSGKVAPSHVLAAMGLGPLAGEAIRVSLPWNTTAADIDVFARAYAAMASRTTRRTDRKSIP
ncbi:MAG: cysteine desulfurase [Rhodospirillales bacterium]|nr:cysteine desulfurase [Rhodospirillales bacterium]